MCDSNSIMLTSPTRACCADLTPAERGCFLPFAADTFGSYGGRTDPDGRPADGEVQPATASLCMYLCIRYASFCIYLCIPYASLCICLCLPHTSLCMALCIHFASLKHNACIAYCIPSECPLCIFMHNAHASYACLFI